MLTPPMLGSGGIPNPPTASIRICNPKLMPTFFAHCKCLYSTQRDSALGFADYMNEVSLKKSR